MSDLEDRLRSSIRLTSPPPPPLREDLEGRSGRRRARRRHQVAAAVGAAFALFVGVASALAIGRLAPGDDPAAGPPAVAGSTADPCPPPPATSLPTTTLVRPSTTVVDPYEAWWQSLGDVASQVFGERFAGVVGARDGDRVLVRAYEGMPATCGGLPVVPVERSLLDLRAEWERIEGAQAELEAAGVTLLGVGVDLPANLVMVRVGDQGDVAMARSILGPGPYHLVTGLPENASTG